MNNNFMLNNSLLLQTLKNSPNMQKLVEIPMSNLITRLNLYNEINETMQDYNANISKIRENLVNSVNAYSEMNETIVKSFYDNFNTITESLKRIPVVMEYNYNLLKILGNIDIDYISDINKNQNISDNEELVSSITEEEKTELKEDLEKIIGKNLDKEEIANCNKKWAERHPLIAQLLIGLILLFIQIIIESNKPATIINQTNVYIEPNRTSTVIGIVNENENIIITDINTGYYYKIIYTDTNEDKDIEGYIAKRNAQINDK